MIALPVVLLAAPRPDLKSYFQSGFSDTAYQQSCLNKVGKSWKAPANWPKPGSKAVVQSAIGRDGKLINALLSMRSGSKEWDEAALSAVKGAAPYGKLPAGFTGTELQVHWHFSVLP
jgi:TonB family protein